MPVDHMYLLPHTHAQGVKHYLFVLDLMHYGSIEH